MEETNTTAEIAAIQDIIRTDPGVYYSSKEKQARLEELVATRDAPQAEEQYASAEPSTADKELAEIREIMRTDPSRYWRDKGMQVQFEQLLQGPEPTPDNPIGLRDFGFARADIMRDERLAPVIAEWGNRADHNVQVYYDRMSDLLTGDIETGHAMEIKENFVGLDAEMSPALARWSVDMKRADSAIHVDLDAAREPFLTTEEGQALKQIWGADFDQNLSKYVSRVEGLRKSVSPEAFERFMDRFDKLSASAAMAVIKWIVRV